MSASPPGADALLFDLGRVVIDIDFNLVFARWAAHARCDGELIAARFRHDDAYKRHERGEIDENAYFDTLRSSLGIEISDAQFLDGWNAIFVGEMPGIAGLLGRASRQVPLYAFTNSNRAHERCWSQRFATALGHFRRIYVSSMSRPQSDCGSRSRKRLIMSSGRSGCRRTASCSLTTLLKMWMPRAPGGSSPFTSSRLPTWKMRSRFWRFDLGALTGSRAPSSTPIEPRRRLTAQMRTHRPSRSGNRGSANPSSASRTRACAGFGQ